VSTAVAFGVVGAHSAGESVGYFDAVDLVVETDTGDTVLFGVRTSGYLERLGTTSIERWDTYRPLSITLEGARVKHWDFARVMWLGPQPHSCLIWSNAIGLSLQALEHLLSGERGTRLLAGPNGAGLPQPGDLGLVVPADLTRHTVGH